MIELAKKYSLIKQKGIPDSECVELITKFDPTLFRSNSLPPPSLIPNSLPRQNIP